MSHRNLGKVALILILVLFSSDLFTQPGLPMAGETPSHATLRTEPSERAPSAIRDSWTRHEFPIVIVYQQQGDWFRVTPDGFVPSAWISISDVDLKSSLPLPEHPLYLDLITAEYERRKNRDDRYCAVLLEDNPYHYDKPDGERHVNYSPAGYIVLAGAPANGWIQTYTVPLPGQSIDVLQLAHWYQEQLLSKPTARYPDGQCVKTLPRNSDYILQKDGGYREGPAASLSPKSFYKSGDRVRVTKSFAGGWLAAELSEGTFHKKEVWFPAEDAKPVLAATPQSTTGTFPAPAITTANRLRIRGAPQTAATAIYNLGSGERLMVWAERGGWYRVTPDGFSPEGWVSSQYVKFTSDSYNGPFSYLNSLSRLTAPAAQPKQPESRGSEGSDGCAWVLIFIGGLASAYIIGKTFKRWHDNGIERQKEKERARQQEVRFRHEQEAIKESIAKQVNVAMNAFEAVPRHLVAVEAALDRAEADFEERAFAPFWSSVEMATVGLGTVDKAVRCITQSAAEYKALVSRYYGPRQPFPIGIESVSRLAVTTRTMQRLSNMVRQAQRDFQFASIFEQRKTNQILVSGFKTLAQALDGMGNRIVAAIEEAGAKLDQIATTLVDIGEGVEKLNSSMSLEASQLKKRHDRIVEILENFEKE